MPVWQNFVHLFLHGWMDFNFVTFCCLMVYQPSWVIQCQSRPDRTKEAVLLIDSNGMSNHLGLFYAFIAFIVCSYEHFCTVVFKDGLVLWHINHCWLFSAKYCSCIYIKYYLSTYFKIHSVKGSNCSISNNSI